MKKSILFLASLLFFATGCYDDYVKDYDQSGVFVAYQYNLRTFVLDEGEQFKFTVALGGVMENTQNRKVSLVLDPSLLDGALETLKDPNKVAYEDVAKFFAASSITGLFSCRLFVVKSSIITIG